MGTTLHMSFGSIWARGEGNRNFRHPHIKECNIRATPQLRVQLYETIFSVIQIRRLNIQNMLNNFNLTLMLKVADSTPTRKKPLLEPANQNGSL